MTRLLAIALSLCLFTQDATAAWTFYRTVTIDHTKAGSSDSTNFPMVLTGMFSYLATVANGGLAQNSSGFDIGFFSDSACSTTLAWEVEKWTNTNGLVAYWIKIPTLSHSVDTVIYMCYDNTAISTDQSNTNGTWNSAYTAVWHQQTAASPQADSTSNGRSAALTSSPTLGLTGQVYQAIGFNGAGQYESPAGVASSNFITASDGTLDVWIKPIGTADTNAQIYATDCIIGDNLGYFGLFRRVLSGNETIGAYSYTSGVKETNATVTLNNWTHAVWTHTGGTLALYINGAQTGTASAGNTDNLTSDLQIMHNNYAYAQGTLDEVRTANVARSADWILSEYNNLSSTGTFYTIGSQTALVTAGASAIQGLNIQGGKVKIQGSKVNIQ